MIVLSCFLLFFSAVCDRVFFSTLLVVAISSLRIYFPLSIPLSLLTPASTLPFLMPISLVVTDSFVNGLKS